jgi:hypothetical protein
MGKFSKRSWLGPPISIRACMILATSMDRTCVYFSMIHKTREGVTCQIMVINCHYIHTYWRRFTSLINLKLKLVFRDFLMN